MTVQRARLRRPRSERGRRLTRKIERPPAHRLLLCLFVGTLFALLIAQGLTVRGAGRSGTPPPTTANRIRALESNAPLWVNGANGGLVPRQEAIGRRVALTFDDGPDPNWTPKIADTLRRLDVPATFFAVGEQVVENPGVIGDLHREGFEIGNHTFTHSDLGSGGISRDLQVSMTQSAISGAAGVRPRLLRPPYSATPDEVDPEQERSYAEIAQQGYVIALTNYDSEDWRRPGVAEIVRNATPPGNRGGVILMHDGGGDRSETVAALDRLVPELRTRGFKFVGLNELLGAGPNKADPPASNSQQVRGTMLIASLTVARLLKDVIAALIIPLIVLAILRAVAVIGLGRIHLARVRKRPPAEDFQPPVTVLVPAYNESTGIEQAVRSLAGSEYPEFEVVVVDDGSTDGTGELVDGLGLPRVRVIREANRGKAEALNTGLAAARHELIAAVDADTVFEPTSLAALVRPLADERIGAVAGNAKVGNRHSVLGRCQHIEYVTSFNLDRRLFDVLGCVPTVPGAVGAFRRSALLEVGGFASDTLAEDTDVTIALGRRGWKVVYAEDARGFTETPASLGGLWRQRYRWAFGTMQSVWKHRRAFLRRGEGPIGTIGLPSLVLLQIVLPLLSPLIDAWMLYSVLFLDPAPVLAYWLGFNLLSLALGAYAFHLDHERPWELWALPLQNFLYRQMMYMVVLQSVASALQGLQLRWHHDERSGDVEVATDSPR